MNIRLSTCMYDVVGVTIGGLPLAGTGSGGRLRACSGGTIGIPGAAPS